VSTSAASAFAYVGDELALFSSATNWKAYVAELVGPHLGARVIEVGAGMGSSTRALCRAGVQSWTCVEPDPHLADLITAKIVGGELPRCCDVHVGVLDDLPPTAPVDAILYLDVLEHIEADRAELERAVNRLRSGGRIVVLSPAHQWLFTPFDAAIGHHRRYSKRDARRLTPDRATLEAVRYVDSVGMLASLGNRMLLQSSSPTLAQVRFWDRLLVPVSKVIDPLLRHTVGKSIVMVWTKR